MEAFSRLNLVRGECMLINTKRIAWIRASAAEGESFELFCTSHTPATSACEMDSSMECLLRHFKAVEWHCCVSQFACARQRRWKDWYEAYRCALMTSLCLHCSTCCAHGNQASSILTARTIRGTYRKY